MKILAAAGAALLIAELLTSAAFAADASGHGARMDRLMRKLEFVTAPQNRGPAAPVTASRSAAFRIAGVINRKSPFTGPVRCEVSLFHLNVDTFTAYEETISEPAIFNGNTGSCNVTVPFRWPYADVASVVLIVAAVYTDCSCNGTEVFRSSTFEFPVVVVPAEGTTRVLGFSVDM
jgi:hypothetical protein